MPHELTPEQLALREQRARARKPESAACDNDAGPDLIIPRSWISWADEQKSISNGLRVKILTFNLLAQCLIRRELFPTSHCLKANQREPMLHQEILSQQPDIMCLQEVDRLEKLAPTLEKAQYSCVYRISPGKRHGCLIAYKRALFTQISDHLVNYDQEEVRATGDERVRQGRSFRTRNIGIIVALKSIDNDCRGIIVATTHLFWHPKYAYERARQAGIFMREILKFKLATRTRHWPCIIAGDFNFAPNDPAYALIVGDLLWPEQLARIEDSRVVHVSVDPAALKTKNFIVSDNGEGEEDVDPDREITNARMATESDGLLTIAELYSLYDGIRLNSVYDIGLRRSKNFSQNGLKTFGDRFPLLFGRPGNYEPEYTSYTHYWKTVLDYIFFLDAEESQCQVLGLLAPHLEENLEPGLPQQGICGSDHISLVAELFWPSISSGDQR
ncbi:hypothetical protein APHAL10511_006308 [Amanita phalloides]|nr:hypothetical protein APHAL10511_006308 [Amanita phalloides]